MVAPNSKLQSLSSNFITRAYTRAIRWAFARFYREFAWTYDTVAALVSLGHWPEWGRAALPFLAGRTLELGCGTGNLQRALARRADAPWSLGLDASPQMLAISRRKLAREQLPARLVRGVAQALPFPNASFDTIVATFPSEYILDPASARELRRVLRPGGRAVVLLAAAFGSDGPYQRALGWLYRLTLQRPPSRPAEHQPASLLARRLAEHGFAVDERWQPVGGHAVHLLLAERV